MGGQSTSNQMERPKWLNTESLKLTLTLGGRYAGEQVWQTQPEKFSVGKDGVVGSGYQTRVQTDFGGVLPVIRKVQISRYWPDFTSLSYSESDGRNKPHFETFFDAETAMITLRQHREEASMPLITPHHDPVSLVMALRSPDAPTQLWRAALTGGSVHVQPLPDTDLARAEQTEQVARAYYLRPGGAYVACERNAPYRMMRLVQPTDFGNVEAHLQQGAKRQDDKAERSEKSDKPRRRKV